MSDNTEMQVINEYYYQTKNNYSKLSNKQKLILKSDNDHVNTPNSLLYGELSQTIQNFYKMDIKEIEPTTQKINENVFEEDLSIMIDELVNLYFEEVNKGRERNIRKKFVLDYFNSYNINIQEIYNWLLNNQTSANSIYLLGYFNYYGIGININMINAFELYQKAAELENILAKYELTLMYIYGEGIDKDYNKAFELSKKLAKEYPSGINLLGYCYDIGIGTEVNEQKAFELYQKAADLGNIHGMNNLACCYKNGIGTDFNEQKAFELYQKIADLGGSQGINSLGCYYDGKGTDIDKQKAFELFLKAAKLGQICAQYNLGLKYENGDGTEKNMGEAIYWYKKSAYQGDQDAQNKLKEILN